MVPRGATGWHVPVLVLVCALLAGGLLIFIGGLTPKPASAPDSMPATVVDTTSCGTQGAADTVEVLFEGRTERRSLDGCGNPVGTELQVEPWQNGSVRVAGTTTPSGSSLAERLSILLLVLAGLAGALLTFLAAPRPE